MPCDGSTMIGRWVSRLMSGIEPRSSVLRVIGLEGADAALAQDDLVVPLLTMYSAAIRNSWIVDDMPRLSITGLRCAPTASSSAKFCALRVPICSMSA